ncbi:50S ribosomal protein L24 [candidate division WWE3 bacterium RIFCSPHIGHO2_01_FULL_40_23]|uniref:Large ribosomal subunit protein uL24 n=1 Tax=candidate division WWE3 bacterium RIFCSPLOWO2_01_FULL_41_18 TaxID=1802625 RepID=A0A1F4VD57_UNCKA|nr:MAG: 50S ribosomal protein L24 [candidate division WWE3 bacterium RIFCSPHIGHO2_01_FULL_40_23]OGC55161.1 MAG: 50S ribosomal protein L24 [candidate division WWE3 bacterium RIFCSPLOWO2_01_FULL_41_18]
MKIKKGDKVKVIAGKDKGKEGTVREVSKSGRVVIEGVNIVKKHVKAGKVSKEGGIISMEKPIDASNVMVVCEKCKREVRTMQKLVDGKKYRVCKRCGNTI